MVILMTTKMILTVVKLMVRLFIVKPVTQMAVMVRMVLMRALDDQVSIVSVFQGNRKNSSSNPPFRMLYFYNISFSILSCKIYFL